MIIRKTATGRLQTDILAQTRQRIVAVHDDELLVQLRDDDNDAFQFLIERYLDKVWKLSIRILGDQDEAEDIVQEVFMTIWQNRDAWNTASDGGTATFSTWVYRVAFNKCIDFKRKRKITVDVHDEPLESNLTSVDKVIEQEQLGVILADMITHLPDAQKQAMHMFYYQDLSVEQICKKTGKTEESIRSLLKRARQTLRELAEDHTDLKLLSS